MKNPFIFALLSFVLSMASAPFVFATEGASAPNDAQIAAIVVAANSVDIDVAKMAKEKTHSASVKEFANRMITDHGSVNKNAVALVTKLNVTPEENDTSRSLQKGGKENIAKLKKLSGNAFDQAYVHHEVVYHESVIDAVDKVLLPNAKNDELKALIEKVRPALMAHLEHAKKLEASLNAKSNI